METSRRSILVDGVGALIACALFACQPAAAAAQTSSQGWPDAGGQKVVVSSPASKKARTAVSKPTEVTRPAKGDTISADVVEVLRQQSALLARLTTELQSQRALILEQDQKLEALYERVGTTVHGPAARLTAVPTSAEAQLASLEPKTAGLDRSPVVNLETGASAQTAAAVQASDADLLKRIRHRLSSSGQSTP